MAYPLRLALGLTSAALTATTAALDPRAELPSASGDLQLRADHDRRENLFDIRVAH